MSKKNKRLIHKIADIDNVRLAYEKARRDHSLSEKHLEFAEHLNQNLLEISRQLLDGTYKRGTYKVFEVVEVGKRRTIYALPFRDSVAQHAINNIIEPIFNKVFYPCSYACRAGKGEHLAARHTQAAIRKLAKLGKVFCLKMDFKKYFASIPGVKLLREIMRKIQCKPTLRILLQFITETGIRIGNLLSQLFANIYGHIFDRFIKTKLRVKYYFRYLDDTVILTNNKNILYRYQKILNKFIGLFMGLKFSKWFVLDVEEKGLNFLGYRIRAKYKLVRRDSIKRAKRKIKLYINQERFEDLSKFLASWRGHISHADSYNLSRFTNQKIRELAA